MLDLWKLLLGQADERKSESPFAIRRQRKARRSFTIIARRRHNWRRRE